MNFKGKDCVIHVPQRLAGMDERMDNTSLVPRPKEEEEKGPGFSRSRMR